MRKIELLAPAKNASIAKAAIMCGADAVYIGAASYGARRAAGNSTEDIAELVAFAHQYRARVYVTLNTILYDDELSSVERLVWDLYRIGVDALIVQDMALLRLKLPPIELHASTQCDIRTVEKARFLQDVGFSQLVLARELTLDEIQSIVQSVDVPVETFVHGALCVSYSGLCKISQYSTGRSANRGACAQFCRLPYTLADADGCVLAKDKHLLSLHDYNTLDMLPKLLEIGVSSFKIEGRLKDETYVKNITLAYRRALDKIIDANPDKYIRSSYGESMANLCPDVYKSFNRGFTHYFLEERRPSSMASIHTPKSLGEPIKYISELNNGDGISYFSHDMQYCGERVNSVKNDRIETHSHRRVPNGIALYRTYDRVFETEMARCRFERRINVDIRLNDTNIQATDERGVSVTLPLSGYILSRQKDSAKMREVFGKLGNSIYRLRNYEDSFPEDKYIAPSVLTDLRRRLVSLLNETAVITYPYHYRRTEDKEVVYPIASSGNACNVSNKLAADFYASHGVKHAERAIECRDKNECKDVSLMTCRYCLLRELKLCKVKDKSRLKEPLTLSSGTYKYRLMFDCNKCEMHILPV
jgi:putative protease